jgi:AcrR family transcriptional regulator
MGGKALARSRARPKRSLRIVGKKPIAVGGDAESPAMRLVLTATRLFNENSIHATGIDRIIAEAGVARRTLYNQFGSKEGLIRAVMQRESKAWFEWLDSELARIDEHDPRKRIVGFFALLGKWFSRGDFKGCSFINAVGEHPLDNCVRPIAKAHRQANFEYIRQLLDGSKISNLDKLADQIAILADGATVTAMVTGNHTMAETAASAALAIMDTAERQT